MKGKQLKFFGDKSEKSGKHYLLIPSDSICIGSIVFVLLLILSYVLGVNKGKNSHSTLPLSSEESHFIRTSARLETEEQKPEPHFLQLQRASEETIPGEPSTKDKNKSELLTESFTIQVASFKNEENALQEKKMLEHKGYLTSICKKGKHVAVFVGTYPTKNEAKDQLKILRSTYKDCFIRRL